jgi:hypothetical protein
MSQQSYRSRSFRRRLLQALVGTRRGVLEAKTARSVWIAHTPRMRFYERLRQRCTTYVKESGSRGVFTGCTCIFFGHSNVRW